MTESQTVHAGPALTEAPRESLAALFLHGVDAFGGAEALRHKQGGAWRGITYAEAAERVAALAAGLLARGLGPGERVAILSENRPEWALADYAALCAGLVSVPIYPNVPADQAAYVLRDAGARLLFVSTAAQAEKARRLRAEVPSLEWIVAFDADAAGEGVLPLAEVTGPASGDALRERARAVRAADVATLIYTSGTTGAPKGVMLTHANLAYMIAATRQHGSLPVRPGDVALSLLPLSHVFERAVDYYYWDSGVTIAYAESVERAAENLAEVRPHVMVSVPRLFEKIHHRATGATGLRRRVVAFAVRAGEAVVEARLAGREPSLGARARYAVADRLVFSTLRARTGGRMRTFISGGAPLSAEVARFFLAARLPVHEGYGLTETSPVLAANRPGALRPGSAGVPYPGVEVRIGAEGEVLARGAGVMKGYWNAPEATAAALDAEGWFHTGDVGEMDADGFLHITDRLKDLIVTAGGKNIAPQPIEAAAAASPFVAQAVLIGDRRPFPVLLVVPDFAVLAEWARAHGLAADDPAALAADPRVREKVEREATAHLEHLARYERPKKVAVLPGELTVESGLLTPTLKVRRRRVEERYREVVEALYAEGRAG